MEDGSKMAEVQDDVEQITNQNMQNKTVDHTYAEVPDDSWMSDDTIDSIGTGFLYLSAMIIFIGARATRNAAMIKSDFLMYVRIE